MQDINVVADLDSHDPTAPDPETPVEADGTSESVTSETLDVGNGLFDAAAEFLETFWTGWWPLLHVIITSSPSALCSVMLHLAVELIGSFEVVAVDTNYYGMHALSAEELEESEEGTIEATESIWNDAMTCFLLAVAVTTLVLTIATIAYQLFARYTACAMALAIWTGCRVALVVYTYLRSLTFGMRGEAAGSRFLILLLSVFGAIAGSLGTLYGIGCRTLGMLQAYWNNMNYWTKWTEKGTKGRSAGGNLICALIVLGLIVVCSLSLALHG